MASSVDNPSFIHFGCWNQLNESVKSETVLVKISNNDQQPVEKVMSTLTEIVKSDPPQFISVAGDNYYPKKVTSIEGKKEKKPKDSADEGFSVKTEQKKDKSEKVKTIILDNLRRGFDLLKGVSPTVPIHVILGNHDLETGTVTAPLQIQGENKGDIGNCTILTNEKDAAITPPANITLSIHKTISDFGSNTLIFMIDTTVYSEDADKSEKCYEKLDATLSTEGDTDVESQASLYAESHSSESRVEKIKREQRNEILTTIQSNQEKQNIVLIGHHPIIEYKQKGTQFKARIQCPGLVELWQEIVSENPDKNYYHLCADVHLYQEGVVTIPNKSGSVGKPDVENTVTIHQHIVGTGGAELDPASMTTDTLSATSGTITVNYTMSQNISTYGLLKCTDTGGVLSFEFIEVYSTGDAKGGKRKTNRRTRRQRNKRRRSRRRRTKQN